MKVLVLLLLAGLCMASPTHPAYSVELADDYFEEFVTTYNKHYANEAERTKRFEIFKHNLEVINQKNSESNGAAFGINSFSDLTSEEFVNTYTGLSEETLRQASQCQAGSPNSTSAPDSWDWRDKNIVSTPKNQETCGSCWAFSAIGNIEAQYAMKHNVLVDLSEQQLVDCDTTSNGCNGTPNIANPFVYLIQCSGAMQDQDYPYTATQGTCKFDASKVMATVTDCFTYQQESEDDLKNIVYSVGPVTIAVDASGMQFYQNGVLTDCPFGRLDHAVLIVGYGTDNGVPFWLIKNSWGVSFGENGFIKIQRGVNACGLMNSIVVQSVVN